MDSPWEYRIYDRQRHVYTAALAGRVELGRQDRGEEGPYYPRHQDGLCRLIMARSDEDKISRKHVLVEPLPGGQLKLTNLSKSLPVALEPGGELKPLASQELSPPVVFVLGAKTVRIQALEPVAPLQTLDHATVAPGPGAALSSLPALNWAAPDVDELIRWMQTTLRVLQSAASSNDFFARASRAVVDLVGLDSGGVLLRQEQDWSLLAYQSRTSSHGSPGWKPSQHILGKVAQEKRTFWEVPSGAQLGSLMGVKAVVAAPILDRQSEVLGALYGDRRQEWAGDPSRPITKLEASLVELLAGGVAAGLARLKEEEAALRTRLQFEQFFTPELSRQLLDHPDLLQGRDAEVTVLICDIRGFSRISERLGPARTVEWINDTLSALSECVLAEHGVLVDYTGDELMAMWGAPVAQPDHAHRACRVALAMLKTLPCLNERWQTILRENIDLGIGVNTGMARVGNVGSNVKFKYGPLGNTVNLASRVQGATKYVKTPVLITQATQAQLDAGFSTRRLGQVRLVNLAQPAVLHELVEHESPAWPQVKQAYEEALACFEKKDFHQAAQVLGRLLADHPHDGPSLFLMSRTIQSLAEERADFDPIWELPGK